MPTITPSAAGRHDHASPVTQSGHVDRPAADPAVDNPETADIIDGIIIQHRRRRFLMEQRKRSHNALGAYLRTDVLGWSRALPAVERDRIKAQAKAILDTCERALRAKTEGLPAVDGIDDDDIALVLMTLGAQMPLVEAEDRACDEMERLAALLPVWSSVSHIRGFSTRGLAVIVGEAGRDLAAYRSIAAFWKRMGVAMINNPDGTRIRQGGLPKNAPKAEWVKHGYDRSRRSRLYVIGESLIKGNRDGKYKALYDARKAYEIARAEAAGLRVVPAAQIPAKRRAEFMSAMHVHRRAQRVMEKELLKDIWIAWRRARTIPHLQPSVPVSAASMRPGRPVLLPASQRRPRLLEEQAAD